MLEAKKHVETKREGEFEIIKKHIINIDDITWKELEELFDDFYITEDPEESYYHGIAVDMDGDIVWVNIDNFMAWIEDEIEKQKDDDDDDDNSQVERLQSLFDRLKKYEGYDINPPSKEDEISKES